MNELKRGRKRGIIISSGGKKTMPHQKGIKTIAQNRKAWHNYFVEDKVECGVVLFGTEVKSVRQGRVNLKESWVRVHNGEVWAEGMHISPYEQGNQFNRDPLRMKKLLLHKSEIRKLDATVTKEGYTLIPLELYLKDGRVKMTLGICRGKQLHDKRDSIAKRDSDREIQRALRNRQKS
jgi:SsrA-binding protein